MKIIKFNQFALLCLFIIIFSLTTVHASQDNLTSESMEIDDTLQNPSFDLASEITNSKNGDEILMPEGTYTINKLEITKNLTIKGNGESRNVIIDGEKKDSIFLIRSDAIHVSFKNITFINANTDGFGGAISIETGHVYVDNCNFINNSAGVNAGGISNYGNSEQKGYLFVNNSFFMNNHANHDGGAITTCYANSDIYNCVFIDNFAHRDGGAIRVSVAGYGNVQDCIFMFNHADEWGGAYYSWSGESNIERCIFMNNTAGTNGGAVMVSGNLNLEDSIIVNNNGGETGGSFYIQQPMYDAKTIINVHNNIITNNSSPYGQEIFVKWKDIKNLYTKFDDNDWGDEDPNDSSINDPNNVTSRIKVSRTIKSDLFNRLNVNLLDKYRDLLGNYFTDESFDNLKNQFNHNASNNERTNNNQNSNENVKIKNTSSTKIAIKNNSSRNLETKSNENSKIVSDNYNNLIIGNSSSHGEDEKAYELNETGGSAVKQINSEEKYFIVAIIIALILLVIGYKRNKKEE